MTFTFAKIDGVLINLSNVGSIRTSKWDDKPCMLFTAGNGDVLHRFYLPNESAQRAYDKLAEYALYDFDEKKKGVVTDEGFRAGWDEAVFHYDIDEDAHNLPGANAGQVNAQSTEIPEYPFAPYWYQFDARTGKYYVLTEGRRPVVEGNRNGIKVMTNTLNQETHLLREQLAQQKQESLAIIENLRETVKEVESEVAMHETLTPQSTSDAQEREVILRRELNATLQVIREAYARLNDSRIHDYDKVSLAAEILEPYTEPKEQQS